MYTPQFFMRLSHANKRECSLCGMVECKYFFGSLLSILTWHGLNFDHERSRSGVRPFHCTLVRLTAAITSNAGDSSA